MKLGLSQQTPGFGNAITDSVRKAKGAQNPIRETISTDTGDAEMVKEPIGLV